MDNAPFSGDSIIITEANKQLAAAAQHLEPIVLLGEEGVGKKRAAQWVHLHSSLKESAFKIHDVAHAGMLPEIIPAQAATIFIQHIEKAGKIDKAMFSKKYADTSKFKNRLVIAVDNLNPIGHLEIQHIIQLPALRERVGDIPLLASQFCENYKRLYHKPDVFISDSFLHRLQHYHWPGNTAELKERLRVAIEKLESGELTAEMVLS
ncbi:MAG: sigma 54-interacting transcriptional regulator [Chitinophagales bacterium]|nr:sigma 54-interacting transcriptional regulator [Chitinophagales bacterium]